MTTNEFAVSDLAARLLGTDATLSTALRDIVAAAIQELIEAELTAPPHRSSVVGGDHDCVHHRHLDPEGR
jgi:hypothetical protein